MRILLLATFMVACGEQKPQDTGSADDTNTEETQDTEDTQDTENPQDTADTEDTEEDEICEIVLGGIEVVDEDTVEFWAYTIGEGFNAVFHAKGDKPEGWPGGSPFVSGSNVFNYIGVEDGQDYWSRNSEGGGTQYFKETSVQESADLRVLLYDADDQLCDCSMVLDLNDSDSLNCDDISEDLNVFNLADYED